jgi:hypothetical protein
MSLRTGGLRIMTNTTTIAPTKLRANAANGRIKREYFHYLAEAKRRDEATIDGVAKALARFEASTRGREFRRFHREQAMAFKRQLAGPSTPAPASG